jgi:glycosyltransferase 2 family protein
LRHLLNSKTCQFCLSLAVSLAVLFWMYLALDWSDVWGKLQRAHLWVLLPSLALMAIQFLLRAARWRYLLSGGEAISVRERFDAIMVGNFATFVLPLRAGEFVRPLMLSRRCRLGFSQCFVSIVIERFFDLSAVLLLFGILLTHVNDLNPWIYRGAYSLSLLAAGIFVLMAIGSLAPAAILCLTDWAFRLLPQKAAQLGTKFVKDILEGLAVLHRHNNLTMVILFTVLVWGISVLQQYVYLYLLDVPPTLWLSLASLVIVALAIAAPSAPGFLGVFEAGWIAALVLFGCSAEDGAAYAVISHLFCLLIYAGYGLFVLFKYQLSLRELRSPESTAN